MDGLALGLDIAAACIAALSLWPLWDVSVLMQTAALKRAWRALTSVIVCCIALLLTSAAFNFGKATDIGKLSDVGIHVLGASFVLAVAWLSRRTARDLLRIAALEDAAFRDPLTGLGNRRCFDACLKDAVSQVRQSGRPLSLIVLDIDHFKVINDTHGHEGGDIVLKQVAGVISSRIRSLDTLCRIGGEEFVIVAPGLDAPFAAPLAERLRLAVAAARVPIDASAELGCTISLGFATLGSDETADSLFRRADAALYASKRTGRNRVSRAA